MFPLQAGHCTCPAARCSTIYPARPSANRSPGHIRMLLMECIQMRNAHPTLTSVVVAWEIPNHSKVQTNVTPVVQRPLCKSSTKLGAAPSSVCHSPFRHCHSPLDIVIPHPELVEG